MSFDSTEPTGNNRQMPTSKLSIANRPIPAGVYSWGWVDYSYGQTASISVVMFDEPLEIKRVAFLYKTAQQSQFRSAVSCYGTLLASLLLITFGQIEANTWLGLIGVTAALISGWKVWNRIQALKELSTTLQVTANEQVEKYLAGKDFLKALAHEGLPDGDIYAYFNLRAQVRDLQKLV